MFLNKKEIDKLIEKKELIIKPLLDPGQVGEISIDFRLGYDFLVSIQGREPFIDASLNNKDRHPISSFFQETRRAIGETFLLHPNQTVLTSSLEFIKMPNDVFAVLNMRSSYVRLGITVATIVQPGYCGCMSLELTNSNKNPVNMTVGAPIIQARFYRLAEKSNYFSKARKYICQVRPQISAVNDDGDLKILHRLWEESNHKTS
ncbi:MAG: dCTP deaminase [Bacteroidia bacterium]|nr:dCTP deaminase [Bacteroidia bacterium]